MTPEEAYEFIPHSFTIACHTITVEVGDNITDMDNDPIYGDWSDTQNKIRIATRVKQGGENNVLTKEQVKNTFYHELMHAFLFFMGVRQDEMITQNFANYFREYENTKH